MIRAFALGLCVGALLHWLAGRSSSLALPPQRGNAGQWDEANNMCPNCVTPWKCNGPHEPQDDPYLSDLAAILERERW